jgi:hypothetical protein
VTAGTISLSSSIHLPPSEGSKWGEPCDVAARARHAFDEAHANGSLTMTKTIGMVRVSFFSTASDAILAYLGSIQER